MIVIRKDNNQGWKTQRTQEHWNQRCLWRWYWYLAFPPWASVFGSISCSSISAACECMGDSKVTLKGQHVWLGTEVHMESWMVCTVNTFPPLATEYLSKITPQFLSIAARDRINFFKIMLQLLKQPDCDHAHYQFPNFLKKSHWKSLGDSSRYSQGNQTEWPALKAGLGFCRNSDLPWVSGIHCYTWSNGCLCPPQESLLQDYCQRCQCLVASHCSRCQIHCCWWWKTLIMNREKNQYFSINP